MAVSIDHLERVGSTFARLWEQRDLEPIGPLYHEADLLKEPLSLGPEFNNVPEGPGLGVELDERQLERCRER